MARQKARSAAAQLAHMQSATARQKQNGKIVDVPVKSLPAGARIVVRAGERIPCDGVVHKVQSDSNRSFLTGEAAPVGLCKGMAVFAGEISLNGVLEIDVTSTAEDSVLRRFIELVEVAERGRDHYRSLADRAASLYAPLVHILALAAFAFWWWYSGDVHLSLTIAIAVLIITCPCALGLAVPAVMTTASGRLFAAGILLKNATALERIAKIDTVVFDKTGTLTTGHFNAHSHAGWTVTERALLRGLASASQHPLAQALSRGLSQDTLLELPLDQVTEHPGCGISGIFDGKTIKLGNAKWLGQTTFENDPMRRLGFQIGWGKVTWLAFDEEIKPGVPEMLSYLDKAELRRILLTGDHENAADKMAQELGFSFCHAAMTPSEKLGFIADLRVGGAAVLMVGDGLNDTGAMAAANAAVAPASALDAARTTADVVLLGKNLQTLPLLLATAAVARRRILQNFVAAGLYNLVVVPLALTGVASPLIAAAAMSASSLTVILNALRLRVPTTSTRQSP